MSSMRLIFMGTPEIAVPTLKALLEKGHEVTCAYTQPPRPAGRGHKVRVSPVQALATETGILVRTPENLKTKEVTAEFLELKADAAVVVAYGLILPSQMLTAPSFGCLNIHMSLLPRWRGAAPLQRAIMAGDTETGVSVIRMDEGLDTGPILRQQRLSIQPTAGLRDLHAQLAKLGAKVLPEVLTSLFIKEIAPIPQREEGIVYAKKIHPKEGELDWSESAYQLARNIRALNPWPGTWFNYKENKIRVLAAQALNKGSENPGTVIEPATIACGSGSLRLETMQRSGKRPVEASAFFRGFNLPTGTILALPQSKTP